MKLAAVLCSLVLVCSLAACGSSGNNSSSQKATQRSADDYAIDEIEKTWHKAASTHNVNLMMTLWARDATFNIGTETLRGAKQIRNFFADKAAPFQPQNHRISETAAYKIRITVHVDKGTLYLE